MEIANNNSITYIQTQILEIYLNINRFKNASVNKLHVFEYYFYYRKEKPI